MSSDFLSSTLCTCFSTSGWAHSGVGAAQSCGQGGAGREPLRAESIATRGGDRRGFPPLRRFQRSHGEQRCLLLLLLLFLLPLLLLPAPALPAGSVRLAGDLPGSREEPGRAVGSRVRRGGERGGGRGAERGRGLQRPQSHRQPRGAAARGPRLVPVTPNGLCLSAAAAGGAGTGTWLGASSAPSAGSGRAASPGDSSCSSSSSPCSWTTCC